MSPQWKKLLMNGIRPAMQRIADDMVEEAFRAAPRLSWSLAGSIRGKVISSGEDMAAIAYATTVYAGWVEVGTSDTPAQPYLRPALVKVAQRWFR
jgi:hypothetical protein